jgi:methyl-accepting chemotaxis protein
MFTQLLSRLRARAASRDLGKMDAPNRTQAVIEFALDGTILDANENFLAAMGYERADIIGRHHRLFTEQRQRTADMEGRLAAIDKAQAVISFTLEGTILEANDNFLATMGYTRDEVVGEHHRLFVDAAERGSPDYRAFWSKLGRGEHHAGLFRRVDRQGREVWIQGSYNPILDMAGRPIKVVKYATDVTAQTRATRTLHAALAELADTVPAIAGQARATHALATEASRSASDGGAMVEAVVDTMSAIQTGARDIADIVSMIDSIAFQTNILALNAAIEAARSGVHGKGFAVVAQEVRVLSQRSAESAREIRTLIDRTLERVREGSERSGEAGEAMRDILASVGALLERVSDVARATDQQAGGIDTVRKAVAELA